MKNVFFAALLMLVSVASFSQTSEPVYGIVRQNYYSTVVAPWDSNVTYQQFDSATIRLGICNPVTGYVTNVGNNTYNSSINLTGASLNPYLNTYTFFGSYGMNTVDLNTGAITNQVQVTNPLGTSYFDNFRFNNSDSLIYGLSRRNYFDSTSNATQGGVFLATINSQTGLITEISDSSLAGGFSLSGSAIDPYQMVYYFAVGNNLIGVDMYNGEVYSNVVMTMTNGFAFGNFTYSCVDTSLYGLVRQNYFSYIPDPNFPGDSIMVLDSATVKLGRVDPATGIVTTISPVSMPYGGYTVNGGAAIDPAAMVYYYSVGSAIVGISLTTGLVVSLPTYSFQDGEYFDLMRSFENCYDAYPKRENTAVTGIAETDSQNAIDLFPNPVTDVLNINSDEVISTISVTDINGKVVLERSVNNTTAQVNMAAYSSGVYFVKIVSADNSVVVRKVMR